MIPLSQQRLWRKHKPFLLTWTLCCLLVIIIAALSRCGSEDLPEGMVDPGTTTPSATYTPTNTSTPAVPTLTSTPIILPSVTFTQTPVQSTTPTPIQSTETAPASTVTPTPCVPKHTVVSGEHLWGLAKRYYFNGNLWYVIFDTNRYIPGQSPNYNEYIVNPNLIRPGQIFIVPGIC